MGFPPKCQFILISTGPSLFRGMVGQFGLPQFEYDPDANRSNRHRNPELGQSCPHANRPFHFLYRFNFQHKIKTLEDGNKVLSINRLSNLVNGQIEGS